MGRKKQFIDKKNATTYHVVYRSAADVEADPHGGDYDVVSDKELLERRNKAAEEAAQAHPLDWLRVKEEDYVREEAQRHEIISLGLLDDGYNYLQHLRVLNAGKGVLYEAEQASTSQRQEDEEVEIEGFVEPEADVAFIDARNLVVKQETSEEAAINDQLTEISAFARRLQHTAKVEKSSAIKEIDEVLAALEEFDDAAVASTSDGAREPVLGAGDLLDDFVLEASRAQAHAGGDAPDLQDAGEGEEEWDLDSVSAEDEGESDDGSSEPGMVGQRRGGSSIASSFWRPARHDRTDALSIIDERFERLALEYDDNEIGDLEDEQEATRPAPNSQHTDFVRSALDEYIRTHRKGHELVDLPIGTSLEDMTPEQIEQLDDETVAKLKAKEAYQRQQAAEASGITSGDVEQVETRQRERWDCESVLSLQSNLENHPATIADEPSARQRSRARQILDEGGTQGAPLQLSAKTGLPLGVMGITMRQPIEEEDDEDENVNLGVARNRNETAEEKKARKAAVKDARRTARSSKKELKQMYVKERVKAHKHAVTNMSVNAPMTHMP